MSDSDKDEFTFEGFEPANTTPVPDVLFDVLLKELSGTELKVLLYIIRRTWGFKKTSDSISLTQFQKGIITRDGKRLDYGCGVKDRTTLVETLASLEAKGCIVSKKDINPKKEHLTTTYTIHFKGSGQNRLPPVVGKTDYRSREIHTTVVGKSPLPVVGKTHPQETVIQETDSQVESVIPEVVSEREERVAAIAQHEPHPLYDYVIYDDIAAPSQVTILMTGSEEEDKARVRTAEGLRHAFVLQEQNVTFLFARAVEADEPPANNDNHSHSAISHDDISTNLEQISTPPVDNPLEGDDTPTETALPVVPKPFSGPLALPSKQTKGHEDNGHDNLSGIGTGRASGRPSRIAAHGSDADVTGQVAHAGQVPQTQIAKGHTDDTAPHCAPTGTPDGIGRVGVQGTGTHPGRLLAQDTTLPTAEPRAVPQDAHPPVLSEASVPPATGQSNAVRDVLSVQANSNTIPPHPEKTPTNEHKAVKIEGQAQKPTGKGRGKSTDRQEQAAPAPMPKCDPKEVHARINANRGYALEERVDIIRENTAIKSWANLHTLDELDAVLTYLTTIEPYWSRPENRNRIGGVTLAKETPKALAEIERRKKQQATPPRGGVRRGSAVTPEMLQAARAAREAREQLNAQGVR